MGHLSITIRILIRERKMVKENALRRHCVQKSKAAFGCQLINIDEYRVGFVSAERQHLLCQRGIQNRIATDNVLLSLCLQAERTMGLIGKWYAIMDRRKCRQQKFAKIQTLYIVCQTS